MKGTVFNIQRYSIHDGTGIRTLVFMKGCPLRCKWCANPEGLTPQKCVMFVETKCYGCTRCVQACPNQSIYIEDGAIHWDKSKCTECFACVKACPVGARQIEGDEYDVDTLVEKVKRDKIFYRRGGGVTVSGGEPLMQADFVAEFLMTCKEREGLHTAIETSSYASWEKAKKVFDYVDLFHMDIKHMDSDVHKELTGVPNELILGNIKRTSEYYDFNTRKMIIRIPVIPGLNSDDENIRKTAEFAKELGTVQMIQLLPYHNMGAIKYERTKWSGSYQLNDLEPMASDELMDHLVEVVKEVGVPVKIGG